MDATANMPVRAIAPWFGSKRNLAARIVELLGRHRCYWEPFCASMAVLLSKPASPMETVGDLHCDLINLALVIRDERAGPALYRRLRRTMLVESLVLESIAALRDGPTPDGHEPDAARAYHYFVASWMGRNGVAGTASCNAGYSARYTDRGGSSTQRWHSAIASIPAWRGRLRKVAILCRDAFEVLDKIEDTPQTAVYCDPPYLTKGARYVHDFAVEDHQRLATALARFRRARVVVSYYDDPRLADLYPGWHRETIEVSKALAHMGARTANETRAVEVLLCNQHDTVQRRLF